MGDIEHKKAYFCAHFLCKYGQHCVSRFIVVTFQCFLRSLVHHFRHSHSKHTQPMHIKNMIDQIKCLIHIYRKLLLLPDCNCLMARDLFVSISPLLLLLFLARNDVYTTLHTLNENTHQTPHHETFRFI